MKKVITVAIPNARDPPEQGVLAVQTRVEVFDAADRPQVGLVKLDPTKQDGRQHESRDPTARVLVVVPVFDIQRVVPAHRVLRTTRRNGGWED